MLRALSIAAVFALALPGLAAAQDRDHDQHHGGPPGGGAPHGAKPMGPPPGGPHFQPGGPPHFTGPMHPGPVLGPQSQNPGFAGPRPGGPPHFTGPMHPGPVLGPQFQHHDRIGRVHGAPFMYPRGWGYRRWAVGAALPPIFLAPAYFYTDWADLGLEPPPPGFEWVRYGPDLLLVDLSTGEIVDVAYGVFY